MPFRVVSLFRPYCRFNIEHCVKNHWIQYGTVNVSSKKSHAQRAASAGSPDLCRLWHPGT
ncbi:hypothetical protein CIW64_21360 [Enterobacter cloacae]|uniref:Uncharacterized protein n=1 Tax=Enterobacter cloacae TaxID=550 RepID=A0AB37VEB1_ENTCL|nr:hypothetical protein CIW69_21285 [Enterobacter cloacae]PAN82876.1 hypothetical protein CIW64_21360 [Enterobacter cloacae]RTN95190.1 hypothetical protein EKN83_13615 [Enterobacter sp. WCHEn090032]RWT75967.1 hypothetical protein DN595_18370 [Enterobacter cloacae]